MRTRAMIAIEAVGNSGVVLEVAVVEEADETARENVPVLPSLFASPP